MAYNSRNNNLAKIHIAKKQLCLDDDTYRDILRTVTGKTSAKDLTLAEALKVLKHFEQHGFKAARKAKKPQAGKRPHTFDMQEREPLLKKIEALLLDGGYTWKYADGIAKKVCKIECVAWCGPPALRKIVAALTYNARRKTKKAAAE